MVKLPDRSQAMLTLTIHFPATSSQSLFLLLYLEITTMQHIIGTIYLS